MLHTGFYKHKQIIDTPVYQHYGNAIADGKVPYRDFDVEYPPGALPMFALPGLARPGTISRSRRLPSRVRDVDVDVRRARARGDGGRAAPVAPQRWRRGFPLCFAALAPLLLGSVILSRFDLWPAAIVAAALAALVSGRVRTGQRCSASA